MVGMEYMLVYRIVLPRDLTLRYVYGRIYPRSVGEQDHIASSLQEIGENGTAARMEKQLTLQQNRVNVGHDLYDGDGHIMWC